MGTSEDMVQLMFFMLGGISTLVLVVLAAFYALSVSRKRMVQAEEENAASYH